MRRFVMVVAALLAAGTLVTGTSGSAMAGGPTTNGLFPCCVR